MPTGIFPVFLEASKILKKERSNINDPPVLRRVKYLLVYSMYLSWQPLHGI